MGELEKPVQIDVLPGNRLVVSDVGRRSLMIYDNFGSFVTGVRDERFQVPRGIGVHSGGKIFIADPGAGTLFVVSEDLKTVSEVILRGGRPLKQPQDVALFRSDKHQALIYILDGDEVVVGIWTDKQE
jgi:hypothetical protein